MDEAVNGPLELQCYNKNESSVLNISNADIRYERSSGGVHIMIYVGGKIKQAAYDNYYPRTNSPGNKLKIKGKKLIRIYRVID